MQTRLRVDRLKEHLRTCQSPRPSSELRQSVLLPSSSATAASPDSDEESDEDDDDDDEPLVLTRTSSASGGQRSPFAPNAVASPSPVNPSSATTPGRSASAPPSPTSKKRRLGFTKFTRVIYFT